MEIVSTMGSGSLGRELDLDVFVDALQEAVGHDVAANFVESGMVTVRLVPNGAAYLFYRTGSIQIRGTKTKADLEAAEGRLLDLLDKIGLEVPDYSFEQRTAVFMETLNHSVDLEQLIIELGFEDTEYEPEQFPALIYKPPAFGVTLLIFSSGKVTIGGTMSKRTAQEAISHLRESLN
jgi:transcription initiation factor TFIID TATA-box-binding protein